ncbi:MAG: YitT family protein [Parachlamydiaceae bacterium]|nr:YitT family protein [Parachlamydiaceae bacterium]
MHVTQATKTLAAHIWGYISIAIGAFLAAFAIDVFLLPNNIIDGGIVGIAMIAGQLTDKEYFPFFFVLLNLPFLYMAYRSIGKVFLFHMLFAYIFFFSSLLIINQAIGWEFSGDNLEVVVIGGAILGIGLGMIIRYGGCLDGTEILGIIANRKLGFTVGQVVLMCNIFIFAAAGLVFPDWHTPLLSLITYMVVIKVMDSVIVGLDETKSVLIISKKSKAVAEAIIHELGLGLTIMYGRGGFSGDEREILYVIAERLQLAELKELIHREDPHAFIAIENLHEVSSGQLANGNKKKTSMQEIISRVLGT